MAITCKTHTFWNPQNAIDLADSVGSIRLAAAAEVLADTTRSKLKAVIKDTTYSRPVYKSGPNAGKWWTARVAGELLKSVRVVFSKADMAAGGRNVWIMVGHKWAYYAAMFEYATREGRGKPFFRPAIAASKARMKSIIEKGA